MTTKAMIACIASLCHDHNQTDHDSIDSIVFTGFIHHDIYIHWWSQYMYYAYRPTTPSVILNHFHTLVIYSIKGPKLRCIIPSSLDMHQPQVLLPAISCLKNFPNHSFSMQDLNESVMSQRRIHMSQSDQEEKEDDIFNHMNEQLCQANVGQHWNDIFSKSIWNVDFGIGQEKENQVMARILLKQLWEEWQWTYTVKRPSQIIFTSLQQNKCQHQYR